MGASSSSSSQAQHDRSRSLLYACEFLGFALSNLAARDADAISHNHVRDSCSISCNPSLSCAYLRISLSGSRRCLNIPTPSCWSAVVFFSVLSFMGLNCCSAGFCRASPSRSFTTAVLACADHKAHEELSQLQDVPAVCSPLDVRHKRLLLQRPGSTCPIPLVHTSSTERARSSELVGTLLWLSASSSAHAFHPFKDGLNSLPRFLHALLNSSIVGHGQ